MSSPTTYRAAVDYLMTLPDFEKHSRAGEPPDFHLRRMDLLMEACGNPYERVPAIHVAGSKGKGSTAALITSAMAANGLKVGLYTSPSLHTIRERIRVGLESISETRFAGLVKNLQPHVQAIAKRGDAGSVSFFEIMTAMAWVHFADIEADFQVVEVGLGGRLDATNLLTPHVSVITPVGMDHVAVLGDTLEKIAGEKAGIIKDRVPVVSGPQAPGAASVIRSVAAERSAPFHDALELVSVETSRPLDSNPYKRHVVLSGNLGRYDFKLPLTGAHQVDNARVAVAALEILAGQGASIEPASVSRGLENVEWAARGQVLIPDGASGPAMIVDGAHTEESASALVETVRELFPNRTRTIMIYGGSGGHDYSATARALNRLNPEVIVTRSRHPKSVDEQDVAKALLSDNVRVVEVTPSTGVALSAARQMADAGDLIVAAGSLAIAAEIIEIEKGMSPEYYPTLRVGNGSDHARPN
jgi:dihydrofolate synthase/folylpolyglutamate synthase